MAELTRQIAAAIGKRVPPKLLWEGDAQLFPWHLGHWGALFGEVKEFQEGQRVLVKVYEREAQS